MLINSLYFYLRLPFFTIPFFTIPHYLPYGVEMYKIYIIKNKINNKIYIGQTKNSINTRWNGHKSRANKGSKLIIHSAMRLHGIENFDIELLDIASSLEEANKKEYDFINQYNCKCPNGYNVVDGGSVEFLNATGPKSEQHKEKIQNSHMKNAKPIVQFDIDTGNFIKEWNSSKELLRNGFTRQNIINLCKSTNNFGYIYGFGWCYKEYYNTVSNKILFCNPNYNPHGRTIQSTDKDGNVVKTYYKVIDAAKDVNCSACSIHDVLAGRIKKCKGLFWRYAD
jgi:group I intron endonuclease